MAVLLGFILLEPAENHGFSGIHAVVDLSHRQLLLFDHPNHFPLRPRVELSALLGHLFFSGGGFFTDRGVLDKLDHRSISFSN